MGISCAVLNPRTTCGVYLAHSTREVPYTAFPARLAQKGTAAGRQRSIKQKLRVQRASFYKDASLALFSGHRLVLLHCKIAAINFKHCMLHLLSSLSLTHRHRQQKRSKEYEKQDERVSLSMASDFHALFSARLDSFLWPRFQITNSCCTQFTPAGTSESKCTP